MIGSRVRSLLPEGGFARSVAQVAGGTALGQILALSVTPILSRVYEPDAFGRFAVFASLVLVLASIASLRYELAIPLPVAQRDAHVVVFLSLIIVIGTTAFVSVVAGAAMALGWSPADRALVWLFALSFLAAGFQAVMISSAAREGRFVSIGRARIGKSIGQATGQVSFGLVQPSAGSLAIGLLAGQAVGMIVAAGPVLQRLVREPLPGVSELKLQAVRFRKFPLVSTWSALLSSASLYGPPLAIAALYGVVPAGFLALAQRVVGNPLNLLRDAVTQTIVGEGPRRLRNSPADLASLHDAVRRRLMLVGLPLVAALALLAPLTFSWLFGRGWSEAGIYAIALAPGLLGQFVGAPLSQFLIALERQHLQLAWDVARLVIVGGCLVVGYTLGVSSSGAIFILGLSSLAAYAVLISLVARTVARAAGVRVQMGA